MTLVTNYPAMRSSILAWLRDNSGAGMGQAVFTRQMAKRPSLPYATIQTIADNIKSGYDDVRKEFNAGVPSLIYRTVGLREMTINVQIYTKPAESTADLEAIDRLNAALIAIDHPALVEQFNSVNMTILSHTPIIPLDEQLGDRWERRASTDLRIMYTAESVDDGGFGNWVDTVEIPRESNSNLTINI